MQTRESRNGVSQELLKRRFDYHDGDLYYKEHSNNDLIGRKAGHSAPNGYRHISIKGQDYDQHRMIFMFHNGIIPHGFHVDHVDRIKANNRIDNLRLVTPSENCYNTQRSICAKGYHERNGKFEVALKNRGKKIHIGTFEKREDATNAFLNYRNLLQKGL